ncbi:MAG: GxxExxY protein, partial [bacterium]|nr:GxxExxY protein [bacterium]
VKYIREYEMPVFYKRKQVGKRRVDFLVEKKISVEIKALIQLENVHFAQAINYIEAYNLEVGLLTQVHGFQYSQAGFERSLDFYI